MKLEIFDQGLPLPLNGRIRRLLEREAEKATFDISEHGIIFNFRDPNYSSETGGYHPVEIAIDEYHMIQYITDFSYAGTPPFVELVKEIDFAFHINVFGHLGKDFPIESGRDFFRVWQNNFAECCSFKVYEITLSEFV